MDIAEHPGEVGLVQQLLDMLDGVVQIMVAQACQIDLEGVQGLDHVLALMLGGQQGRREHVPRE